MDLIPGGLAQGKSPNDFDQEALIRGIRVEMEHATNSAVAREIAMDHLTEDPEYYEKLARMESGQCDKMLSKAVSWFIEKANYWQHVDGTYWWRNPASNQIEPYNPGGKKSKKAQDIDVATLKELPQTALNAALFSARMLVTQLGSGLSHMDALGSLTRSARDNARLISDPSVLNDRIKAFSALGLAEASNVYKERLQELSEDAPEPSEKPLGSNEVLLNGERMGMKIVKTNIGGSTGAYVAEVGGKKYVVKEYKGNTNQVKNEYLANSLYNEFSLYQSPAAQSRPAPKSVIGEIKGGQALFSPFVKDMTTLEAADPDNYEDYQIEETHNAIKLNFVLDAWLANWDVIGLTEDNIGISVQGGVPLVTRLDNGGALLYRAQGAPKGNAFGNKVTELDTMRDRKVAPTTARWFGDISDKSLLENLNAFESKIKRVGAAGLYDLVSKAGFSDRITEGLTNRLMERFDSMMDYRDDLQQKMDKKVADEVAEAKETGSHPTGDSAFEEFTSKHLRPEQRLAIKAFTKVKEEYDPRNYYDINKDLVEGSVNKYAKELMDAIEDLPRVSAMTVRGIEAYDDLMDHWQAWTSGSWSKVEWKAFSSSTLNPGMAFDAADGVSFIIMNKGIHGRYVAPASDMATEDEVLYKPGSKFRVVGYSNSSGVPISYGHTTSILGNALILEEVSDEDWKALPSSQEPPKKWTQQGLYDYIHKEAKPTEVDRLTRYKKENPF